MTEELTVSEFNDRVNSVVVNSGQLRDVSVVGEISGAKRSTAGHIYFDLKDGNSLIHCTLFKDWLKTFIRVGKVTFIDVSTKTPLQATPAVPTIDQITEGATFS